MPDNEGIAWTLFDRLSDLAESEQQESFYEWTPFEERLPSYDMLKCAAIVWFAAAATSYRDGDVEGAFDWLSEAHDALSLANGNHMWDEGAKLEREAALANTECAISAARTSMAKAAARARHSETRNMKADVFKWLDAHMADFKSMDGAAQAITRQQPIAFRTARDWTGEWKKLRSAGKP